MLSRDLTAYPDGSTIPLPAPPAHMAAAEPAGTSGIVPSRFEGRQHTLTLTGPCGAGDAGYMGRDVTDPDAPPVPEGHGLFARLHIEARA